VRLRQDRGIFWDRTLAEKKQFGTDVNLTVVYECRGTGSQVVFTEVLVDEGRRLLFFRKTTKARSENVSAPLCG
jgi:hypothetical protein